MTTSRLDFTRTLKPGGALEFVSRPRQDLTGEISATANRPSAALSAVVIYQGTIEAGSEPRASLRGTVIISCELAAAASAATFVSDAALDINVFRGPSSVASDAWQQRAISAIAGTMSSWERSGHQRAEQSSGWQQGESRHQEVLSSLQGLDREAVEAGDLYQQAQRVDTSLASTFSTLVRARDECSIVYEQGTQAKSAHTSGYRYPPRLRTQVETDSQPAQPMGFEFQHSMWGIGAVLKADSCSMYELGRQPSPGRTDIPVPPIIPEVVISARLEFGRPYGVGGHLEFYWSQRPHHVIPTRRVYLVTNKVQFVRASDGMPIPSTSVSIEGDTDSWAWQFTASLPRVRDAESLEGEEVIITINDHEWRCIVDGWSDNRSWGQQSATVTGRGLSAELSSGLHLPRSYTEPNTRSIIQLAEQELPSGWMLDWQAADWVVPGGVWAYSNLSPVDAIQKIADAAGAFIAPGMNDRRLTVLSKYVVKPWELTTSDADISIPESIMLTLGRQRMRGQAANGIWISGGNGFAGHVKRVGTAGGNTLADVSRELITDAIGARALGTALLANSLSRSTDSIELPISVDTGLILPGRIIETSNGIGYGRGLRASASVDKDRRLSVRQVIEVERPLLEDM